MIRKYWRKSWPLIFTLVITAISYLMIFGFSSEPIDVQLHDSYFVLNPAVFVTPMLCIWMVIMVTSYQIIQRFESYLSFSFMLPFLLWLIKGVYVFLGYMGTSIGHYRVTPYAEDPIYPYLRYFDYLLLVLVLLFFLNLILLFRKLRSFGILKRLGIGKEQKI